MQKSKIRNIEYFGPLDVRRPAYLNGYPLKDIKLIQTYPGYRGKELFGKFKAKIDSADALFLKLTTVNRKFHIY
jgi:hypothetical protein